MIANPYIETVEAVVAKASARGAVRAWRNSFTTSGWELHQLHVRQALIDSGATVRADGRLEIQVPIS